MKKGHKDRPKKRGPYKDRKTGKAVPKKIIKKSIKGRGWPKGKLRGPRKPKIKDSLKQTKIQLTLKK